MSVVTDAAATAAKATQIAERRRQVIEAYFDSRGGLPLPPNVGMLSASQVRQLASSETKHDEDGVGFLRWGCDAIVVPVFDR